MLSDDFIILMAKKNTLSKTTNVIRILNDNSDDARVKPGVLRYNVNVIYERR